MEYLYRQFLQRFTFHNVSINSTQTIQSGIYEGYLHSIMYLLIRERDETKDYKYSIFTFHNVSINSGKDGSGIVMA